MATLRLFASRRVLVPPDPDQQSWSGSPTPGRLNVPDLAHSGFQAAILLVLQERTVLYFSDISARNVRKVGGGHEFQACILLNRVPNGRFSRRVFLAFPCFLVFSVIRTPHPVVLFAPGAKKVSFRSLSSGL